MQITEAQKKLAAEWEENQRKQQQQQDAFKEDLLACESEATQVTKFLSGLGLKERKTILAVKGLNQQGGTMEKTYSIAYVLGKDIHFAILSNAAEIMKMCSKINQKSPLNGLQHLSDSVLLLGILIQLKKMDRVIPHMMTYSDPKAAEAKRPKLVQKLPAEHMAVTPHGFYIFTMESSGYKQFLWLGGCVFLAFFFLLFRVWPEWLRLGVWYVSWYLLVFLIGTAVVRAIVWFIIFHLGIDFWIFPNYFIDSDNILDSFIPILTVEKREDIFDARMFVLRIASAFAVFYGVTEFLKDPENLESVLAGGGEIWTDVYDWGQNKFMGNPTNDTALQVKKSARQIYAEAFMEDENSYTSSSQQYFADEEDVREAYEKDLADKAAKAEMEQREEELDEAENREADDVVDLDAPDADAEEDSTNDDEGNMFQKAEAKAKKFAENAAAKDEAGEKIEKDEEEKLKAHEAEQEAKAAADEKAKKEDDERKARSDAEKKVKQEAEDKAKAEAKAKKEADDKAKKEAEDKAKYDAKAKKEAEDKAKAEAKAKKEAEDKAKAEAKAKKEAEDKAKAEEKAKKEADDKAKQDAKKKEDLKKEAEAKKESEKKAEPKKTAEPKKDEPKKAAEPKKEAKKAAEPKKAETKKEEPKKETPKKEQAKAKETGSTEDL